MILITGGAHQGKTDCTVKIFGIKPDEILDGEVCDTNEIFFAKAVRHFEQLLKRLIIGGGDALRFTEELCAKNSNIAVICTEIGCGIIPMEKTERLWREETGRACCLIAEKSDNVIRVCCGIPAVLKGELP